MADFSMVRFQLFISVLGKRQTVDCVRGNLKYNVFSWLLLIAGRSGVFGALMQFRVGIVRVRHHVLH